MTDPAASATNEGAFDRLLSLPQCIQVKDGYWTAGCVSGTRYRERALINVLSGVQVIERTLEALTQGIWIERQGPAINILVGERELAYVAPNAVAGVERAWREQVGQGGIDYAALARILASQLQEMLCDQEMLAEPARNEALCEKARALLDMPVVAALLRTAA